MDINSLSAADSIEFELKYPSGKTTGVVFDVVGQFSSGYNKVAARVNAIISKLDCADDEKSDRRITETAIACVRGWKGLEETNEAGEKVTLEFSEDNCRRFLDEPSRNWIATQIYLRVIGEKGFFGKA